MITKNKKSKKIFIPLYYDFNISCLGSENYKITTDTNGNIKLYFTPIIRTLLMDMKNHQLRGQENLCRTIKEKLCPNSRLLIRYSIENSKIILIHGIQFIVSNSNIQRLSENTFRIMNDKNWEKTKYI